MTLFGLDKENRLTCSRLDIPGLILYRQSLAPGLQMGSSDLASRLCISSANADQMESNT